MIDIENLSDELIEELLSSSKTIINEEKTKTEYKYKRKNIHIKDTNDRSYQLYLRLNIKNANDFSCGIALILPDNKLLTLMRCNGNSHKHCNKLEKQTLEQDFHIHKATERYYKAGLKIDGFAYITKDYRDIEGAYTLLINQCNVQQPESINKVLFGQNIW